MTTRKGAIGCLGVLLGGLSLPLSAETVAVRDDHLKPYTIQDFAIRNSLTGKPGDPTAGAKIAVDRQLGNCLGCHAVPIPGEPFPGSVGPDLAGVGARLTEGELRLRLVDPKRVNEATSMPAFYKVDGLNRVATKFAGKPILTAEQIEDLVAYLASLKQ